jgi:serine kinase of HPr protein (carbohydrate metabolism regulator)
MTAEGEGRAERVAASCIVLGAWGLMVRGPSGSGKSALCWALLNDPAPFAYAALVGDDQLWLRAASGRLIAEPAPAIAGRIEIRGLGIVPLGYEPRARIALVADLVPLGEIERLPVAGDLQTELCGLQVPRLAVPAGGDISAGRRLKHALAWLASGRPLGAFED